MEVEGEGFVLKSNLIHESWEFINRDGVISESHDSRHLGGDERSTGSRGDFTELHGGLNVSDSGNIFTSGTLDTSGSVGDVEILSILNVGGGFGVIEGGVGPAWDGPAGVGVNPKVGGTGIWDHGEFLWWGTDGGFDEVLSVHEVGDDDLLSSEELVGKSGGLGEVLIFGHFSLLDWDSSSVGGGKKCGDGEFHKFLFYYLIMTKKIMVKLI